MIYITIIDCFDNAESRQLVQDFARKNQINCFHAALAANGEYGLIKWDETFEVEKTSTSGQPTCQGEDFTDFICVVASYIATTVKEFLKGNKVNYYINPTGSFRDIVLWKK